MKREDLIKLITDNFAEGEEVSFRYCDDQSDLISAKAFFEVDVSEYVKDGYWQFFDENHKLIRDHVSKDDYDKVAAFVKYAFTEWVTTKTKVVKTKVIDVAC